MADQLWSRAVKYDWVDRCAVCGRRDDLNSHHVIGRVHQATRYLLRNGICLCGSHHQFNNDVSPHGSDVGWNIWLEANHPELDKWTRDTRENGRHRAFDGTTNAAYYIDMIQSFREYVPDDEFSAIVGVKFGQYLETLQEEKPDER
jgi:hypothetical protein